MTWGRSLAGRLFGVKRRSRRLRAALRELAAGAALAAGRAGRPEIAAYHDGERAGYVAALGKVAGAVASGPTLPPASHRAAWSRGFAAATDHADRLIDRLV